LDFFNSFSDYSSRGESGIVSLEAPRRKLLIAPKYAFDSFLMMFVTYLTGKTGNILRYHVYKKKLRHLGEGSIVDQGVIITETRNVSIKDHSFIDKYVIIVGGEGVEIGRRVHIAQSCLIQGVGSVKIGDYVGIAAKSMIFSATDTVYGGKRIGPMVPTGYKNPLFRKPVIIEKDAFIGAGCIVLPGVRIGEGAVVGAGSLVTRNIPSWKVAIGSPAKPIKDRPKISLPDF